MYTEYISDKGSTQIAERDQVGFILYGLFVWFVLWAVYS